jgi:3-hydroxypropanoate dehydrogenase
MCSQRQAQERDVATLPIDRAADVLKQLFFDARTHRHWQAREVTDDALRAIYEAVKVAPTSTNCSPGRFVFVKSKAAKARLVACLSPHDAESARAAPVTVIVAQDLRFYDKLPKLFPECDLVENFEGHHHLIAETAFRNSTLQGAYLIMASRALGFDCGAMSGFDRPRLDAEFFPDGLWTANFLVNLGYGDETKLLPRLPRLSFDEACRVI